MFLVDVNALDFAKIWLDNGWNSERNKLTDKNDAFQRSELNEVNEVNK